MFGTKTPRTSETILAQLEKKHAKLLRDGENYVAVCDAFDAADPHPEPLHAGWRQPSSLPITNDEALSQNAAAHLRIASVQSAVGLAEGEDFGELPASKNQYLLAHTQQRLFVFDGSGKTYLLQADLKGLWLQAVDHQDDMFTLIFRSGDERVAVSTRRESVELTRAFIASFPDRRGHPRVVTLDDDSSVFEL